MQRPSNGFIGGSNEMTALLTAAVIFGAFTIEGLTGFGGSITALTFLVLFLELKTAVTLVLILSSLLGIYTLLRRRSDVDWQQFLRIIGYMAIGVPAGLLLGKYLPENVLKLALGAFTFFAGAKGLLSGSWLSGMRKGVRESASTIEGGVGACAALLPRLSLVGGGIIHSAFGTGGPIVVIYAKKMIRDRTRFRATLICVWLTLNLFILALRWQTGQLGNVADYLGYALGAWAVGVLLGSYLSRKVSAARFDKIVSGLLVAVGIMMIVAGSIRKAG